MFLVINQNNTIRKRLVSAIIWREGEEQKLPLCKNIKTLISNANGKNMFNFRNDLRTTDEYYF